MLLDVVSNCRSQYEEAAADVDTTEASQRPAVDDDTTLDPLQQARKRRQRLAAVAAASSRAKKRPKLTTELQQFMARTTVVDLELEIR
jgi:hypothetical protein